MAVGWQCRRAAAGWSAAGCWGLAAGAPAWTQADVAGLPMMLWLLCSGPGRRTQPVLSHNECSHAGHLPLHAALANPPCGETSPAKQPRCLAPAPLQPHRPAHAPMQCIGPSMMPTFNPRGDVTLVEHVSVWTNNIQIGDVVLARSAQVRLWCGCIQILGGVVLARRAHGRKSITSC